MTPALVVIVTRCPAGCLSLRLENPARPVRHLAVGGRSRARKQLPNSPIQHPPRCSHASSNGQREQEALPSELLQAQRSATEVASSGARDTAGSTSADSA